MVTLWALGSEIEPLSYIHEISNSMINTAIERAAEMVNWDSKNPAATNQAISILIETIKKINSTLDFEICKQVAFRQLL